MSPIRPSFPAPALPASQAVRPEARAAQRAFFQAAVNRTATAAPAASAPAQEPVRPVAPAARTVRRDADVEPGPYLRPGSLLDIKV